MPSPTFILSRFLLAGQDVLAFSWLIRHGNEQPGDERNIAATSEGRKRVKRSRDCGNKKKKWKADGNGERIRETAEAYGAEGAI